MYSSKTNQAIRETHDSAHLNGLYRHSFKLEFALSDESQVLLSHMYAPAIIQPGPGLGNSGGHQVGAAHQRVADQLVTKHVKHLDSFIEIGPHPSNFSRRALGKTLAHGCTLRGGRDQQRHANAAASSQIRSITPNKQQFADIRLRSGLSKDRIFLDTQALASGIDTETFCTSGFGNCLAQSQDAIAVHSLYDIGFQELARGMDNHGVHRIKAYMHFPSEAMYVDKWEAHDKGYLFETVERDGKKVISFCWLGDCAFGYEHDQDTWLNYLLHGGFDTPFGFSVLVEKTRFWGSQFELNISRVTASTRFFYGIPSGLNTMLRIPNYRKMAVTGFCKRKINANPEDYYIVVDRKKYERVWNFAMARTDTAFTVTTIKAFVRTVLSSVVISGVTYEDKWNVTCEEVGDVCLSIYIMGRYTKRVESLVIDEAFHHMEKVGEEEGWFTMIVRLLTERGFPDVLTAHGPRHHSTKNTRTLKADSDNAFHAVFVKHFEDFKVRGAVKEHGLDMEVRYNPFEAGYDIEKPVMVNKTLEDVQSVQAYETQNNQSAAPDWVSGFGIPLNMPVEVGHVYGAQEQQLKLIEECAQGALKYKDDKEKEELASLLESTKLALMKRPTTELHLKNMYLLTGVPGGAKTGKVKREIIPVARTSGHVLVICPTKALAVDYNKEFVTVPNCKAVTTHVGIVHLMKTKVKWGLLVVEEAYTQPMGLINFIASFGPTLLVGDGNQITHVDFSGTGIWNGCSKLSDYAKYIPRHHLEVTKRCPQDIAATPIMRRFYPGISSTSKVVNSMQYVSPTFNRSTAQVLCFTQSQKQELITMECVNALTVHEVQGKTFESVILHYAGTRDEQQLLKKSPNHLIVGLTRHTKDLYIRDVTHAEGQHGEHISRMIKDASPEPGAEIICGLNDSVPLSLIADRSNIDLNAIIQADKAESVQVEQLEEIAKSSYTFMHADSSLAAEVIGRRYPATAPSEYASIEIGNYELGEDAVGLLNLGSLGAEEAREAKAHKVYRFVDSQRVQVTKNYHSSFATKSMMGRLTKKTKNMGPVACEKTAARLAAKVIDEFNWEVSPDFEQSTFFDAVQKMHERGQNANNISENTDWRGEHVNMCKSHLKDQQKPVIGKDPLTTGKLGQAIVAWDKTLNLMVAPWVRKAEQVLYKQSKGRVRLLNGLREDEVISIMEAETIPGESYIDNDWTEFDSNQNNLTRALFAKIMEKVGMPEMLLEQFKDQMKRRKVVSSNLLLWVNDKLDSGAPQTLGNNCLYNLAVCLDIMVNITKLYIKGDDSLARGVGLGWDMEQIAWYEKNCGAKLKPGASGTFVSFLVTEHGVAYDLIRIAAKILSRFYINQEDFLSYQVSIAGQFSKLSNSEGMNMTKVNAVYHDKCSQSIMDFDALLSFINRFARGEIKFSELVEGEAFHRKTEAVLPSFTHGNRIVGERREAVHESWLINHQRLRTMGRKSAMGFARMGLGLL